VSPPTLYELQQGLCTFAVVAAISDHVAQRSRSHSAANSVCCINVSTWNICRWLFGRALAQAERPGAGLGPFGEAPVSYFAPEPRLAAGADPDSAARELKQVVAALHREGIEVLLQVRWPSK